MQIVGEWLTGTDGVPRPVLWIGVRGADGKLHNEPFLVDTGADRSVLIAGLVKRLRIPPSPDSAGGMLQGIGGHLPLVSVATSIQINRADGEPVQLQMPFAVSTDPHALDNSLLGRDILNHFDLILSRPRRELLLLAGIHQYAVSQA